MLACGNSCLDRTKNDPDYWREHKADFVALCSGRPPGALIGFGFDLLDALGALRATTLVFSVLL